MTEKETIVLASASPRRQELLRQIGFAFRVVVSDAEELSGDSISPDRLAEENARRKAKDVAAKESGNVPVLGADTVVVVDGMILGKPKDAADAARMLRLLSGRQHFVYTGIALAYKGEVYGDVVRTEVWVDELSEKEIDAYIATGEPMDKAGAYAVQGIAAKFIPRIDGSFSNVVGLPLHAVKELARKAGIVL
ncbi:MAG: septum formation inhibitor Maf [Schwartzia sp.]|nr:septum formation inhibitor Maf [Schwartzia sp. (in: firmicutes)]